MSEQKEKKGDSVFRNLMIPNLKNALQSASFQHEIGNHDMTDHILNQAKSKLDECIEQNLKDKRAKKEDEKEGR